MSVVKQLEKQLTAAKKQEAANKAFRKLSKAEKRVALAKDVLADLKAKRIIARVSVYVKLPDTEDESDNRPELPADAQEFLQSSGIACEVCALGALFTSTVRRRNCVTMEDFLSAEQNEIRDYLADLFSVEQLALIETAFESDAFVCGTTYELSEKQRFAAEDFGQSVGKSRSDAADERLTKIMKNIIKNGGTFVP